MVFLCYKDGLIFQIFHNRHLVDDFKAHFQKALSSISENVSAIKVGVDDLLAAKEKAVATKGSQAQAEAYCNEVKPLFDVIRTASDALEMMVDDELWPMTKYREMLFTR